MRITVRGIDKNGIRFISDDAGEIIFSELKLIPKIKIVKMDDAQDVVSFIGYDHNVKLTIEKDAFVAAYVY